MRHIKSIQLSLLALILLAACGKKAPSEAAAKPSNKADQPIEVSLTPDQAKLASLELGKIELKNIGTALQVTGKIDVPPQNLVSISIPAAGFLKSTLMLPGTPVKKGQLLATIQNPEFIQMQQDYLQIKNEITENESQLEYLAVEYNRQQELAKENVNSGKTLQAAKAQYLGMKARIEGQKAKMGGLKARMQIMGINVAKLSAEYYQNEIAILSPISGGVTKVNANIGRYINTTDVLFEIVDNEHQHVALTVFEKDLPKIHVQQNVRFVVTGETKERNAKVYLIGREINPDRTVLIHCHIDKEDNHLLPNAYLKAWVEVEHNEVTCVPTEALVTSDGMDYIFVVNQNTNQNKTGNQSFTMIQVKKGVSEGDFSEVILPNSLDLTKTTIVTKGAFTLLAKLKIAEEGEE
jgi:cobalt-zinc-cadmium efflux system membrane fusion protein